MSAESETRVVLRTSQPGEADALAVLLADAGIPLEIQIVVQASREPEAVALIEAHMRSIGAAPSAEKAAEPEETDGEEALLPCPNCEAAGIVLHQPCGGCGFEILKADSPPATVKGHAPGARTFCPECRDPLTFAAGKCARCSEELEPLESGDLLCPNLTHVLYRDTVGGVVCKACKRVWVALA